MQTIKTLRLVNTEYLTAFRAAPPFFFASDEMPYAEFSDVLEIVDHAHAILGSVPLIQIVQPGAKGKLSQPKQYLTLEFTIFSQFLIRHVIRTFFLRLSSPRQPRHGFLSLVYATRGGNSFRRERLASWKMRLPLLIFLMSLMSCQDPAEAIDNRHYLISHRAK